jgi:hypothetical protein
VTTRNIDLVSQSRPYAWRVLGLLPSITSALNECMSGNQKAERRQRALHDSMEHAMAEVSKLCSKRIMMRFADGKYRWAQTFVHFFIMDGAEQAQHACTSVQQCFRCTAGRKELSVTDRCGWIAHVFCLFFSIILAISYTKSHTYLKLHTISYTYIACTYDIVHIYCIYIRYRMVDIRYRTHVLDIHTISYTISYLIPCGV